MRVIVTGTAVQTGQAVARWGEQVPARLAEAAQSLAQRVRVRIIETLSSELKHPGGRLAQSIEVEVTQEPPARARVRVGSTLPYAAVLESGFSGTQQVAQHLRMMTIAFGRPVPDPRQILVSAHARRVDLPAHHIFSGPLADMQGDIARSFALALKQGGSS